LYLINLFIMRSTFLSILLFLFLNQVSSSQDVYTVKFRIHGIHDTTCLLANYFGNGTYIKDSLKVDRSGRCVFKSASDLPKGVYLFIINPSVFFEFIIDNDKSFSLETDTSDLYGKMVVRGSPENELFYHSIRFVKGKTREIESIQTVIKNLPNSDPDSIASLKKEIDRLNDEIKAFNRDLVKSNPETLISLMILSMQNPDIPEAPILLNGRRDSTFAMFYYTNHFWDGTDFSDDRLLRTPGFHKKLEHYYSTVLDNYNGQSLRYIIHKSDSLIGISQSNPEMFKYMVSYVTMHYERCEIMGFDSLYVHMVDTYYKTGKSNWLNKTISDNIIKKADRLRPLLIGKIAPNMIMLDTNNQLVSMHSIRANLLLLLFWDPDCGHCETEIPKIHEIYNQFKESCGMEVFSICSDTSILKWKAGIKKRNMNWINVDGPRTITGNYHDQYDILTTPVVYILNEQKVILAKQLRSDQIRQFITSYCKKKMVK